MGGAAEPSPEGSFKSREIDMEEVDALRAGFGVVTTAHAPAFDAPNHFRIRVLPRLVPRASRYSFALSLKSFLNLASLGEITSWQ